MTWDTVQPVLPDLLLLQARLARLRLVDKLQAAEMHLQAAGLDASELRRVRTTLLSKPLTRDKPMFPPLAPAPTQQDGTRRLRHLIVSEPRRV